MENQRNPRPDAGHGEVGELVVRREARHERHAAFASRRTVRTSEQPRPPGKTTHARNAMRRLQGGVALVPRCATVATSSSPLRHYFRPPVSAARGIIVRCDTSAKISRQTPQRLIRTRPNMKRFFLIALTLATFSGCNSSREYSSLSEPVSGPRPLDPIVSTPRNWDKPVKSQTTVRVEEGEGSRTQQGTVWERAWHGE